MIHLVWLPALDSCRQEGGSLHTSGKQARIARSCRSMGRSVTQEDDNVYGVFGDHTIRKEVKPVKESYNEILGKELSQDIANSYRWFYDYFQYL